MDVSSEAYRQLADFRHHIREFLHFSEAAARSLGIEPQQHQLLLAVKGLSSETRPTVRALSTRLCIRHNSTVELINRLAKRGALVRRPSEGDRREVLIEMTPFGHDLLQRLSMMHLKELHNAGPSLLEALKTILSNPIVSVNSSVQEPLAVEQSA